MPEIYHMIYVSEPTATIGELELSQILESSVKNNRVVEVTGLLIARERVLLQMLEGSKPSVRHVYERIKLDERHKNCKIILETTSKKRIFPSWYMGRLSGAEIDATYPEILEIAAQNKAKKDPKVIIDFFKRFSASVK